MSRKLCGELTLEAVRDLSASVGQRSGWDFSRVRDERAPAPWDYVKIVRQFLNQTDFVLDTGTGGGEIFITLAPYFEKGIGIDAYSDMIEQARQNWVGPPTANVDLVLMNNHHLAYPDAQFDMVLNRHSNVNACEVCRVLRTKGYFLTQQVARRNTLNILDAFGWTPASFGDGWWQPMEGLAAEFERLGCQVVAKAEYDVPYWFSDVESLVFWLKAVPLPEPFDVDEHWRGVNRIIAEYRTPRGIETNEHRELLIVQKV